MKRKRSGYRRPPPTIEVLALLIEQGMRYVILAPNQAKGELILQSLISFVTLMDRNARSRFSFTMDHSRARSLSKRALASSRGLVEKFVSAAVAGDLVNVATDGETYGHHFKFGDLCLTHALKVEAKAAGFWITNYAQYLDHHPPETEVEIDNGPDGEGSSWSCVHGVGRWSRDCGCHTGGEPGWNQAWRKPLREALNFLRDDAAEKFESVGE